MNYLKYIMSVNRNFCVLFVWIMAVLITGCEMPGGTRAESAGNSAEVSESAVRATEERLQELNVSFDELVQEMEEKELAAEEETIKALEDIRSRKDELDQLAEQYNSAMMSGAEAEAKDIKEEINSRIDQIQADISDLKEKKEKVIERPRQ
jgi:ABC-type lipoprotein release transport system permease subunit